MKITALVQALVDAGASPEMILAAVRAMESAELAALDTARAKTRARVEKWRATKAGNVTDGHVTVRNDSRGGDARVEDISLTHQKEPQERKQDAQARDVSEFKAAFPDLDEERMAALLKHRRSKHAAVTGYAARLFRRDAEACGMSIAQAVDTCVSRNWITVKPEYMAGRARASPGPPQQRDTVANAAKRRLERLQDERRARTEIGDYQPTLSLVSVNGGRNG